MLYIIWSISEFIFDILSIFILFLKFHVPVPVKRLPVPVAFTRAHTRTVPVSVPRGWIRRGLRSANKDDRKVNSSLATAQGQAPRPGFFWAP